MIRTGFAILLLFVSMAALAEGKIDRGRYYRIFGDVDLAPTTHLEYGRPRIVIKAITPILISKSDNPVIDTYNELIDEIIAQEAESFKQAVQAHEDYQSSLESSEIKNDVIIDFDSYVLNKGKNPILSLRFVVHGVISGMTGSYRHHRVLNYLLDKDMVIDLVDLFEEDSDYLEVIADSAREQLRKKLRNKSMIADGTLPTVENFRNWNLTPRGLRITFEASQVAPAKFGSQTITIPYKEIKEIIEPDSILATCLKRKWRCFGRHVVTGGFIDEAKNKKDKKIKHVAVNTH